MTRVVLICEDFDSHHDDRAMGARVIARHLARTVGGVHVVCRMGRRALPERERVRIGAAWVEVSRLGVRSRNAAAAFAAAALVRVHELEWRGAIERVWVVDAPACGELARVDRALGGLGGVVGSVSSRGFLMRHAGQQWATREGATVWDGPGGMGRGVVVPSRIGETEWQVCARGYAASAARERGWAMLAPDGNGSWVRSGVRGGVEGAAGVGEQIAVVVDSPERFPVGGVCAIAAGRAAVIGSGSALGGMVAGEMRDEVVFEEGDAAALGRALDRVMGMGGEARAALARELRRSVLDGLAACVDEAELGGDAVRIGIHEWKALQARLVAGGGVAAGAER